MKLHEKIESLRNEQNISRQILYYRLKEIFGEKAITYRTLERIEKGDTDGTSSSLHQIAMGLGVTLKQLWEGTEEENPLIDCVRRYNRKKSRYTYNKNAYAEFFTGAHAKFLAGELVLRPKAKTIIEQDPESEEKFQKLVYVVRGTVICKVNDKDILLRKGDSLFFYSHLPHLFLNPSSIESRCVVVQCPRHI